MSDKKAILFSDWDEKTKTGVDWIPGAVRTVLVRRQDWSIFEQWLMAREETKKMWYKLPKGEHSLAVSVITLGRVA